jgi:adenosylhomocysteine nucleosidase
MLIPSGSTPPTRIALFAATGWEVRAVWAAFPTGRERNYDGRRVRVSTIGDQEFWLVQTGIGPEKAAREAAWLLPQQTFQLVVSTGFACALVPATIGALMLGCEVSGLSAGGSEPSGPIRSAEAAGSEFLTFVNGRVPAHHRGPFVSVDQIVVQAAAKRRYAGLTGAIALDMESAALATVSQRSQVPFIILRTVSDLLDEDLPLDFNLFLRPTGWARGLGSLLMGPSSLRGIGRLRRQSRVAAARLTDLFRAYADMVTAHNRSHAVEPA